MTLRTELLQQFWRFLDQRGIRYCVVGDTREFPEHISSDVDIVVPERNRPRIPSLIAQFCAATGGHIVQVLVHESSATYFVLAWLGADGIPEFLALDFCGDYRRAGRALLGAEELLDGRISVTGHDVSAAQFFVPKPSSAFIYYLVKKVDKGDINEKQLAYLVDQWRGDTAGAEREIARFWSDARSRSSIVEAMESANLSALRDRIEHLRRELRRGIPLSWRDRIGELMRKLGRLRRPTGMLVAVLGADGSGKSTVIDMLTTDWEPAFRRSRYFHLRPRLWQRSGAGDSVDDPHGKPPRGRFLSCVKVIMFALDYAIGYQTCIRPWLARATLVVFDRYYHDLLLDPIRYRLGGGLGLARLLKRGIPRPHHWLVLDSPSEVLQRRKTEVSPEASERQNNAYRKFAESLPDGGLVNTDRPLSEVRARVNRLMMHWLAESADVRISGRGVRDARNPATSTLLLTLCQRRVPILSKFARILFNCDIYCKIRWPIVMPHPYGIIIHSGTVIGRRVTLMQQVTLGAKDARDQAPVIEDDVFIGAGAKVLGGVRLGRGAMIGANAVVTRDVPAYATVVGANRVLQQRRDGQEPIRVCEFPSVPSVANGALARPGVVENRR